MEVEKKMSQTHSEPSHDSFKPSKFIPFREKLADIFFMFMRIGLILCLVASILLALHSAFTTKTQLFPFPDRFRNISVQNTGPTNVSHILFGIGASVRTWQDRSRYSQLWWVPNISRGFVWLDQKPGENYLIPNISVPYRVSEDWTRFKYIKSQSAVRIARIVLESFKLGLPNVRWFVMGDDDTVFFTHNLVSVLARYDHNQMYYIGGNSESVEQDVLHSYDMAFGGGGFAVSYPLAARLVNVLDGCLDRYYYFYGSDQRIWACMNEIGVSLTKERGFHQLDIRGDPYGLLAAHPQAPLVSLHHINYLKPMFPSKSHIHSLNFLIHAYQVDPPRILQQSLCYDHNRKWSISISWGYTVQIYPSFLMPKDLLIPLQTFKTWRSWSNGPFTFNTRRVSSDPCQRPVVYFLDRVEEVGKSGSKSVYKRFVDEEGVHECGRGDYGKVMEVNTVSVSSVKLDPEHWNKAPRRQCCEIMDHGRIKKEKNENLRIRIRKCRPRETITV